MIEDRRFSSEVVTPVMQMHRLCNNMFINRVEFAIHVDDDDDDDGDEEDDDDDDDEDEDEDEDEDKDEDEDEEDDDMASEFLIELCR